MQPDPPVPTKVNKHLINVGKILGMTLSAAPLIWVVAVLLKAAWFRVGEGRWPRYWRDDPVYDRVTLIDQFLNGIVYGRNDIVFIAFMFWVPITMVFWAYRGPMFWRAAACLAFLSCAVAVLFMLLDPGRLFTWLVD